MENHDAMRFCSSTKIFMSLCICVSLTLMFVVFTYKFDWVLFVICKLSTVLIDMMHDQVILITGLSKECLSAMTLKGLNVLMEVGIRGVMFEYHPPSNEVKTCNHCQNQSIINHCHTVVIHIISR